MKTNIKHYEHARELVDKYLCVEDEYEGDNGCGITPYEAKQCALIAVDEIINCDRFFKTLEDTKEFTDYWCKVQQEIEKL